MKKPVLKDIAEPKRKNRAVKASEAIEGALDPVLRRRGFASRDILTHWAAMAPKPFDKTAMPDKLSWPRGERGAAGATLYLRCLEGQRLMLSHEAPRIAAAINRYFGYVLVDQIRLSPMPFTPGSAKKPETAKPVDAAKQAAIGEAVRKVEDDRLRQALTELGLALGTQRR